MAVFFTRSSKRELCNDSVRLARGSADEPFPGESPELTPGRIVNAGRHGVCLEIDHALEPGTNVSIEMVPPGKNTRNPVYKVRRGQVIWCRRLASSRERHYGAGVEIFEKVVQTEIPVSSLV